MKIFFFIRTYNDIDHGLPLLDYLVRNKSAEVKVYSIGNDCNKHIRHISYIKKVLSLHVGSFEQENYSKLDKFLLVISNRLSIIDNGDHGKIISAIYSLIITNLRELCFWLASGSAKRFVANLPEKSIVMADMGTENKFPFSYIIPAAQKSKIPIIAYNHGYTVFSNVHIMKVHKSKLPKIVNRFILRVLFHKKKTQYYDKYLVGQKQADCYYNSNMYPIQCLPRFKEIGLPRYSYEWEQIFVKNWGRNNVENTGSSINIALFLSDLKFNVNSKCLKELVDKLIDHNGVNFKIVSHTRQGVVGIHKDAISYVTSMNSTDTIEWADIGVVYGSSIAFQMLTEDVLILIPKFIQRNRTIFEDNNVAIISDSLNEMMSFINNYKKGKNMVDKEDVSAFIQKYVYGGYDSYSEMMEEYYKHIIGSQ